MMDQQPDKLFRDKLEGYSPTVPPQVWNRITANAAPKRTLAWWLSAAAVTLLASAVIFLYPLKNESTQVARHVVEPPRQQQSPAASEPDQITKEPEEDVVRKENATAPAQTNAVVAPSPKKRANPKIQKQRPVDSDNLPLTATPEPKRFAVAREEATNPRLTTETNDQVNPDRKTITIVFSAEEVNQKYLSKTNQRHATSEGEEASTLKNMLDKAYDLTHNQNPMGELRQKKNEILAMNFRKDKPRTQND